MRLVSFSLAGPILLWLAAGGSLGAATITGSVVENATGRPLARTKVVLHSRQTASPAGQRSRLTGSGGEFSFPDLPAGIYYLRAERSGYAAAKYGQRDFESPGTPIVLDAQGHFIAAIRLRRLGVITGVVSDENQVGIPGLTVHAYRMSATWKAVASARTDDRGVYRLTRLKPGRYLIRTAAGAAEGGIALMPTYYGQSLSSAQAEVVQVRLDEETDGIDISPNPGRLGSLAGNLVGGGAREVLLITATGPRRAPVKGGGRFNFGQLEPGPYTLLVAPNSTGGALAAYQEVVLGQNPLEVQLKLLRAPTLTIACSSATSVPVDPRSVSIFLRRKEFGDVSTRVLCGDTSAWAPGNWLVGVSPPPQYYVAAILEGQSGNLAHEFHLVPGEQRRITILFASHPGVLSGTVTLEGAPVVGAPVFLNAYDAELRSRSGGVRTARADENGKYRFVGLPPGRYEVVSSYQIRDPEGAGWPLGLGTAVTVEENKEVQQDLTLTVLR